MQHVLGEASIDIPLHVLDTNGIHVRVVFDPFEAYLFEVLNRRRQIQGVRTCNWVSSSRDMCRVAMYL